MDDTSGGDGRADGPPVDEPTGDSSAPPWDERAPVSDAEDPDGPIGGGDSTDEDDGSMAGGNVAGEFTSSGPVEPGQPDLENAIFVAIGAFLAILTVARLVVGSGGFTLRSLALVTGITALVTLICFGFFGLLDPDT